MNRLLLLSCLCWLATASLSAQLYLTLKPLPDGSTWGVYVKPCDDLPLSNNTITGSGQVTLRFPVGYSLTNLVAHAGTWYVNATAVGPTEAPGMVYASVGFITDSPKINYHPDLETLLFTFKLTGSGTAQPTLLQNGLDPFDQLPNSFGTNPGNEVSVIDFGVVPTGFYNYSGNYYGNLVSCSNVPQDTTVTNPPQDTTVVNPPQDTTVTNPPQDTTVVNPPQDTTVTNPPQDTTVTNPQDSTIVTPPDSTGQGGTTTNVFDLKKQNTSFDIAPNPTYDWTTIIFKENSPKEGILRLWAYNGSGIGILERRQNDKLLLNLSGLPAGLYFLTYESDGKVIQREKLIKQ